MPIYEYECEQCGTRFERLEGMDRKSFLSCPECGAAAKRVISGGTVVISKGSGRGEISSRESCARESPCCGREIPCEKRPCDG